MGISDLRESSSLGSFLELIPVDAFRTCDQIYNPNIVQFMGIVIAAKNLIAQSIRAQNSIS